MKNHSLDVSNACVSIVGIQTVSARDHGSVLAQMDCARVARGGFWPMDSSCFG